MGIVRDALHRLGEHRFAVEVTAPMTAEEALATGSDLERVGETLRERAVSEGRADVGQTFIEDCDTVAAASEWYREVGEMGFGIQFIRITTITGGIPSEPRAA